LADLPTESRGEVVDAVRPVVGVDVDTAEALIRAAEHSGTPWSDPVA